MSEKLFFIKKPIPIEAYKFDPARKADYIVNLEYADGGKGVDCKWGIQTLEGMHEVKIGDWIITGVRGERYPIKGDIFEETYAPAPAPDNRVTCPMCNGDGHPAPDFGCCLMCGDGGKVTQEAADDFWKLRQQYKDTVRGKSP